MDVGQTCYEHTYDIVYSIMHLSGVSHSVAVATLNTIECCSSLTVFDVAL